MSFNDKSNEDFLQIQLEAKEAKTPETSKGTTKQNRRS